jgi:hypothetical protein
MLRRFGWDEVYGCAGEEEAKKVLVNIKKRKERAKRKKANGRDDEDEVSLIVLFISDTPDCTQAGRQSRCG